MGVTLATLRASGKIPEVIERLINEDKTGEMTSETDFIAAIGILSTPQEELSLIDAIIAFTSYESDGITDIESLIRGIVLTTLPPPEGDIILLARLGPILTKKSLKLLT